MLIDSSGVNPYSAADRRELSALLVAAAAEAARLGLAGAAPEIADGMIPFNPVVLARRLIAQTTLSPQQPLQKRGAS